LLASPLAETIMNMHSWPTCVGTHENGPTTTSPTVSTAASVRARPPPTASRAQEVGLALGAQAGEARLREIFEQAGFGSFRRATETPLNIVFEAKV
jgi:hypothetical protein